MIFPFQVPHRISTTLPPSCFSCVRPLEVTVPEALKKRRQPFLRFKSGAIPGQT
ncbi:hypothetical protein M5E88_07970 [Akkermansia muciniphila]|nr:hypothetical protein M5E88_07970 [Akkermansia muciniphila]